MIKLLFTLLLIPFMAFTPPPVEDGGCCAKKKNTVGRCTGNAYCMACKNCSGCKYCNSGGTCGVCAGGKPKKSSTTYGSGVRKKSASTCQALTKKGTQCSRKARSGGYCWQHGG